MRKFKFGLETLLKYRVILQKQQERRLGEAGKALKTARDEMAELRAAFERTYAPPARDQRVDVIAALLLEQYRERLAGELDAQRANVAGLQAQFNERRDELAKAVRNKKVIVKLKDKALFEHRSEIEKEQQKLIDEMIAVRSHSAGKGREEE